LSLGLKIDRVSGWITVWLSLECEGCKVDPSMGGGGLEVGDAELGSGGGGTSSIAEEPWALVAWALAEAT